MKWEYSLYGDVLFYSETRPQIGYVFYHRGKTKTLPIGVYYVDGPRRLAEVRYMSAFDNMKYVFEKVIRLVSAKIDGRGCRSRTCYFKGMNLAR